MDSKRSTKRLLSPSLSERNEKLELLIQALAEKSLEGAVIIVEGAKDARALRRLGVPGHISCVKKTRRALHDFIAKYVDIDEELIIFTDFDREGTQLAGRMARLLESRGKHPNLRLWMKIKSLISSDVKDVEGLASHFKKH